MQWDWSAISGSLLHRSGVCINYLQVLFSNLRKSLFLSPSLLLHFYLNSMHDASVIALVSGVCELHSWCLILTPSSNPAADFWTSGLNILVLVAWPFACITLAECSCTGDRYVCVVDNSIKRMRKGNEKKEDLCIFCSAGTSCQS